MIHYTVKKEGLRLDLFLKEASGSSRKQIKKYLDEGRIKVNHRKVVIASWELEKGDIVHLDLEEHPNDLNALAKDYFLKVVFEDDDLLVVEKNAGIACEPSPTSLKPSLPEIILEYLKRVHPQITHPTLVKMHRLDRPTTGLMVYGKTKRSEPLLEDFKTHRIQRRYMALVHGNVSKDQGRIDLKLTKIPDAKGKKMLPDEKKGKTAITDYRVLQRYNGHTLLEVNLHTGRTHQVRAHLAHLGHPIVGDHVYGKSPSSKPIQSLGLHASEIGFIHPVSKQKVKFKSKPPKEFSHLQKKFWSD
ncbi:MAG: RluA family pseudouridine synthase [Deltaproteobacteria bacterium]|nr:RluA family pseudouridine synthase [Deltaproteobacteria bacterium]